MSKYKSYEVEGCRHRDDGLSITVEHDPRQIEFFTVYGRTEEGLAEAMFDFTTEQKANDAKLALDALKLFRTFLPNFQYEFLEGDVNDYLKGNADYTSATKFMPT